MCGDCLYREDRLHSRPAPRPLPLKFSVVPTASGPVTHSGYHPLTIARTFTVVPSQPAGVSFPIGLFIFLCCKTLGRLTPKKEKIYTGPCLSPLTPKEETDLGQRFLLSHSL